MPSCIEIFCGLGGLSHGFSQAGYQLLMGLDIESEQLETFSANHPNVPVICKDIRLVGPEEVAEASGVTRGGLDVLLGGPPCQGFSTYGKRNSSDPRNSLYVEYSKLVDFFQPRVVVLENVVGILSMDNGLVVKSILQLFKERFGYTMSLMVLDAANYGVPQFRRRVFFVGYRNSGTPPRFPIPITRNPRMRGVERSMTEELDLEWSHRDLQPSVTQRDYDAQLRRCSALLAPALTVRDAISDLPLQAFKPRETLSGIAEYSRTPQGSYQLAMRNKSRVVLNHAAKQHLLKRQARTLLIEQGQYGSELHERQESFGKVAEFVRSRQSSPEIMSILQRARSVDVKAEGEFVEKLMEYSHDNNDEVAKHMESGGFANKYRRLEWDKPSHTLVAHMARDCSDFIHPSENRPISVREAARLQSFDDRFVFRSSQFRQLRGIGNSVPPLLARALAQQIKSDLGW